MIKKSSRPFMGIDHASSDSTTILSIDIETCISGIAVDNILWTKRSILEESEAKILYDLGMHDTLDMIEIYGYDWSSKFIIDALIQRMSKSIYYPTSTFYSTSCIKKEPESLTIDRINNIKSSLMLNKTCYDKLKNLIDIDDD